MSVYSQLEVPALPPLAIMGATPRKADDSDQTFYDEFLKRKQQERKQRQEVPVANQVRERMYG